MEANIIQKAEDIISAHDKAVKDFETVCHAGICPVCGETLELHSETIEYIQTVVGPLSKKEVPREAEQITIACPEGHKLIHPKGYDASGTGLFLWQGCLNKEISDYWRKYHDDDDDFS